MRKLLPILITLILINYSYSNVIVITVDTVRSDMLNKQVMPNLSKLVQESLQFNNSFLNCNYTPSSHASIFTSTHVSTHKLKISGLNKELAYLPQIMKENGYVTYGAISALGTWSKGFERGFDYFNKPNLYYTNPSGDFGVDSTDISIDFINWLKDCKTKNIFAWLHYFDAHFPYKPNKEYNIFGNKTKEDLYKNEVYSVDYAIGKVLDYLKEIGKYDTTTIIVTNDHGETMTEQMPYYGHSTLNTEVVKELVIIKFPQVKCKQVRELFESIDIAPTLLDYLDIPIPYQFEGESYFKNIKKDYVIIENNLLMNYSVTDGNDFYIVSIDKEYKIIEEKYINKYSTCKTYCWDWIQSIRNKISLNDIKEEATQEDIKSLKSLGYITE